MSDKSTLPRRGSVPAATTAFLLALVFGLLVVAL